jgi:prepilin peptidase CpaA
MTPLLHVLPLLVLLGVAAWTDLRQRRIPNWLNAAIFAAGLAAAIADPATHLPWTQALGGAALGFALMAVPFALGALRGGDVKLITAVGAWVGPLGILAIFVIEKLYALVYVLAQAIATGRLRSLAGNSARLAVNIVHVRDLGIEHVEQSGERFRSIDRPLPYAVPVMAAVLTVLAWGWTGRA